MKVRECQNCQYFKPIHWGKGEYGKCCLKPRVGVPIVRRIDYCKKNFKKK